MEQTAYPRIPRDTAFEGLTDEPTGLELATLEPEAAASLEEAPAKSLDPVRSPLEDAEPEAIEPAKGLPERPDRTLSDPIQLYLKQMARVPLLSREDEIRLSKNIAL